MRHGGDKVGVPDFGHIDVLVCGRDVMKERLIPPAPHRSQQEQVMTKGGTQHGARGGATNHPLVPC
jgi:hypothetical protein